MDRQADLVQAVMDARSAGAELCLYGQGSKRDWLKAPERAQLLSVAEHTGVVEYQPTELVVTARAGTTLKDLQLELSQHGQRLASDPPQYYGDGTVGGAVSAGLSGPSRPWRGRLRDAVLGVRLINGLGEALSFGGQVMKNVAGYDVSRLVTGAAGALGVVSEVSLRVEPQPDQEVTLAFDVTAEQGLQMCRGWARQYLPITATCWHSNQLSVRLSGSESGLDAAHQSMGGEVTPEDRFWSRLRDHQLEFFRQPHAETANRVLWKLVVPPATPIESPSLIEWGGGLRWIWAEPDVDVQEYATAHGGWAWPRYSVFSLPPAQVHVMRAIKQAFDPDAIFASPLELTSNADRVAADVD